MWGIGGLQGSEASEVRQMLRSYTATTLKAGAKRLALGETVGKRSVLQTHLPPQLRILMTGLLSTCHASGRFWPKVGGEMWQHKQI